MEDDGYLTDGLCPGCFTIDFDSTDLSYGPRPVTEIVAGCKIGCTFCGLLTYSLDLKYRMVDTEGDSIMSVCLSTRDQNGDPEYQGCLIATLCDYKPGNAMVPSDITVIFDIIILHDEHDSLEDGKA